MADGGLSVNVPGGDDEQAGDTGLSLGNLDDEEQNNDNNGSPQDYERAQAGLNSPKGDGKQGGATPNTLRTQFGVNSPRKKGEVPGGWGAANDENGDKSQASGAGAAPSGIESLVTQVSRDDPTQQIITSVQKEDSSLNTEQSLKTQTSQPTGMCACLCSIFSCCSNGQADATTNPQAQAQQPAQSIPKSKPNDPLIEKKKAEGGGNGKDNDDEKEESYTDTEYPPGLLPPLLPEHVGKKCLVLDLDETLVHSSFKPIPNPDFIIPVEIDNVVHRVYVMKRPFVDEFLVETAKDYEIVIFTASLSKYADPLLDKLDTHQTITHRLFRESCVLHGTAYVKDLRTLGRRLRDSIIVDNSPPSYLFQPINAIPILSWFDDQSDTQLRDILPCMKTTLKNIKDVRNILDANSKSYRWLCQQANKPLEMFGEK